MKKLFLALMAFCWVLAANAQYDYHLNGRNDVPVLGKQWGLTAGFYTAMLKNRDDMNADKRLDLSMMNPSYAFGGEINWWFQNTVAFGIQGLFWSAGGAYTGLYDSANSITLKGNTTLQYFKMPFLFQFKSYNRYYPDRRVRFNACFGPYMALMSIYSDSYDLYDAQGHNIGGGGIDDGTVSYNMGGTATTSGKFLKPVYNPLEFGFVVGVGGELRLSRRTVLSVMFRADQGITDVENKKDTKFKQNITNIESNINYWKGMYCKFYAPTAADIAKGWEDNRPDTKNVSFGAFLTFRKYFRQ